MTRLIVVIAIWTSAFACRSVEQATQSAADAIEQAANAVTGAGAASGETARFAVIGDYGRGTSAEAEVAALVRSWNPDFIVTTGDNNYPRGEARTIDAHIGRYYQEFIYPYRGTYGDGAQENRFFPVLGNHDWGSEEEPRCKPHLDYFELPHNERYYEFTRGPAQFFMIDSDAREPDGVRANSKQAQWIRGRMLESDTPWQLVLLHHAPYSSGAEHGSSTRLRWPFAQWGADAVLSGHEHLYERLEAEGITYFINGAGGAGLYDFKLWPLRQSRVRYSEACGAMLVTASPQSIVFEFYNVRGERIDSHTLTHTLN